MGGFLTSQNGTEAYFVVDDDDIVRLLLLLFYETRSLFFSKILWGALAFLIFGGSQVQISTRLLAILAELLRGFPQCLLANAGIGGEREKRKWGE
jgi:hypothetical protein